MTANYPIYTTQTQCHDCYKCVRHCPVKSIKVENGHAQVITESCVACGTCVLVCPTHAKAIRNDVEAVKKLLTTSTAPSYLSLAPAWISSFTNLHPSQLTRAIRQLGFAGVSETALGAQEVSSNVAAMLTDKPGLYLSSACPAAVGYIRRYLPEYTENITPVLSPVQSHAKILRNLYGSNISVVFAGPCIAKKIEADRNPHILSYSLTFEELKKLFEMYRIDPAKMPVTEDATGFVPNDASDGSLYPIEGGMMKTLLNRHNTKHEATCVSGIEDIEVTLRSFDPKDMKEAVFIECLACKGGCINGPAASTQKAVLNRRLSVTNYVADPDFVQNPQNVDISAKYTPAPVQRITPTDNELREALLSIGKTKTEDELNCGGCGYNSCREFAAAMLAGQCEPRMCVSNMRRLAQKKANVLLTTMPSGVVLVDNNLEIVDSNRRFAAAFGEDNLLAFDVSPGLRGCRFDKIAPFGDIVREVLESGKEKHYRHMRFGNVLLDIAVFIIEPNLLVGAIVNDVTVQETLHNQIAQKANDVIKKNIATVQEIACTLGEHMAETEILLRAIAEGYGQSCDLFNSSDFNELNKES